MGVGVQVPLRAQMVNQKGPLSYAVWERAFLLYGARREEALENLQEALALYFEEPHSSVVPDIKKIEVEIGVA